MRTLEIVLCGLGFGFGSATCCVNATDGNVLAAVEFGVIAAAFCLVLVLTILGEDE